MHGSQEVLHQQCNCKASVKRVHVDSEAGSIVENKKNDFASFRVLRGLQCSIALWLCDGVVGICSGLCLHAHQLTLSRSS